MEKKKDREQKKNDGISIEAKALPHPEEEEDEEIPEDLFGHRVSLDLTPENARFFRSEGGLVSLKLTRPDGSQEAFERVVIKRSFPVTAPDEFLSVREPDSHAKRHGEEIGMIRSLSDFDPETAELIRADLEVRYFTPELLRITSVSEKFGYYYWEMETSAGKMSSVIEAPFKNIRRLEDGRVFITDMNGNCFLISDPSKLDHQTYRALEVYL